MKDTTSGYLDSTLGRDDAVHRSLREWIKLLVLPPHEVRLQQVATVAVVLKFSLQEFKMTELKLQL